MKHFGSLVLVLLVGLSGARAAESTLADHVDTVATTPIHQNEWSLSGSLGYRTASGVAGGQIRRFVGSQFFATVGGGFDLGTGALDAGFGWKTLEAKGTCFFFIDCSKSLIFSAAYIYYPEGDASDSHWEGCSLWHCEHTARYSYTNYHLSDGDGVNASLAWQDRFGEKFFYELELGYLFLNRVPEARYVSGPQKGVSDGPFAHTSGLDVGIRIGSYL